MVSVSTHDQPEVESLVRQIRREGDGQWSVRFPKEFSGRYVGLRDPGLPMWSLLFRYIRLANRAPEWIQGLLLVIGFLILGPLDLLQLPLRLLLLPVLQVVWVGERYLASLIRRSFFCTLCHNPMPEPYVFCRPCNRVQGKLYPQFGSLLIKICPECARLDRKGKSSWKTLGNFLLYPPNPLVCRDTQTTTGCYRPHRLPNLVGKCATRHVVVTGVANRTKHPVLAHFIREATSSRMKKPYRPVGRLSELEAQLAKLKLSRGLYESTNAYEALGERYTLALSFVLHGPRGILALHNLCQSWLGSEENLFTKGVSWRQASGLLFAVDLYMLRQGVSESLLSHVELLSRIIRVIEKDHPLLPGTKLPLKLALVVPIASNDPLRRSADAHGALAADFVETTIAQAAPAFYALCRRSTSPARLRCFGGVIPADSNQAAVRWMGDVVDWLS